MSKLQLLIWGDPRRPLHDFARFVHGRTVPALLAAGPARLKLSITEEPPPRLSILPLRRVPFALFSVWTDEERPPSTWQQIVASAGVRCAGYRVIESVPRAYERSWADGQRSPGVVLLTLLRRKRGLSRERFLDIWHGEHTPLALTIHPLWSYVRNVVDAPITPGGPLFDGIVEEHFRERTDVLRPWRMFGGGSRALGNMLAVARHVPTFLELSSLENHLVREYHLRS